MKVARLRGGRYPKGRGTHGEPALNNDMQSPHLSPDALSGFASVRVRGEAVCASWPALDPTRAPGGPNSRLHTGRVRREWSREKGGARVPSPRTFGPSGFSSPPAAEAQLLQRAPRWVQLLVLWPSISEESFADFVRVSGVDAPPSWEACAQWLLDAGVCEPVPGAGEALVVRPAWVAPLDDAFSTVADPEAARMWLGRAGNPAVRQGLMASMQQWARRCARWDALDALWAEISEDAGDMTDAALASFIDVPVDARKDYPGLTWACAIAEANAAERPDERVDAFLSRLLLDASLLHADWALREETDEAVQAGTIRMVGERWLPASGGPLDAAWRTKHEIDALIDERSRRGQPPGRLAHSFFRALSAQLALLTADLRGAAEEARWAAILAEGPPVTLVAHAVQVLSSSFAGEVDEPAGGSTLLPADCRLGGLAQLAAVMLALARGRNALIQLDRRGVEANLRLITPDMAAIYGLWVSWVSLRAFGTGLWGDPVEGLNRLLDAVSRQAVAGREQDEPTGSLALGHVRAFLLSRIGARDAAEACADSLPEHHRAVSQARARLWAGQPGLAVRIADAALPDPLMLAADRQQLMLIRGAATALEGHVPEEVRAATQRALRVIVETRRYLPLALLPAPAATAILDMAGPLADDPATVPRLAELRKRLAEVNAGGGARGLLHLTERESILLPLLATDLTVPQIAAQLNVSANTVRKQVSTLREKFGASSRAELIRKASAFGAVG